MNVDGKVGLREDPKDKSIYTSRTATQLVPVKTE